MRRAASSRFAIPTLALLLAGLAGCAYGGGGGRPRDAGRGFDAGGPVNDAGGPLVDSGPPRVDTGVPGIDSGPTGVDSGPTGVDSGPPRVDSGPTGIDSGPPRVDSGPTGVDSGPGTCTESPCRLVGPQCGCMTGQACYVSGSGTRGCATAGALGEGQACMSPTDCRAGLTCVGLSPTVSTCLRFCDVDRDCTGGAGSLCVLQLNDASGSGTLPGVTLCTLNCDLATNAGCPAGTACEAYYADMSMTRLLTHCREAGPSPTGGFCTAPEDCAARNFCATSINECVRYCRRDSDCTFPAICNIDGTTIIGSSIYGYCY